MAAVSAHSDSRSAPQPYRRMALLGVLASLPIIGLLVRFGFIYPYDWPLERSGFPIGRDFANLWAGARAAIDGNYGALFDAQRHIDELARLIHPRLNMGGPKLWWSYPPTAFWLGLPFAWASYATALGLWTLAGLAGFCWAARIERTGQRDWRDLALLVAAPGTLVCMLYGQTALVTSALLIGGLALADRKPWLAGALLAALVTKPHLGLVVPLFLIVTGAWRAVVATAVFAALYLLATVLAFGLEPWWLFLTVTLPKQYNEVLMGPTPMQEMLMSGHWLLCHLGLSTALAIKLHWVMAAAVFAVAAVAIRRTANTELRLALAAVAALLASPYMQLYESALGALVAIRLVTSTALARQAANETEDLLWRFVIAVLVMAPALSLFGTYYGDLYLGMPLFLVAFGVLVRLAMAEARTGATYASVRLAAA